MKFCTSLLSVLYLVSLHIFTCDTRLIPQKTCQRLKLEKDTENLYNKTARFKELFPKDNITDIQFLTEELKQDFMAQKNCNLRNNFLSFYIKTFLEKPPVQEKAKKLKIIQDLMVIQDMLLHCKKSHCDHKETGIKSLTELKIKIRQINGNKVLWKAISEMDTLLEWIYEYVEEML
ncbi:interleukin-26 precursor [Xenopus tropicalis]|uniref:Interleukin 22 n=1 Tax=Xenopus tropicalis TaxID=8364 RepID=B6RCW0_XENTR|nr:interleukin-26 precursor [Xenopus tropicalis]ABU54058.1 interleukin-26 [Xenopus tropicalis]|eukprot:NP_001131083.1 interleukin-26 precursor [Xenopus tropicalis]